MAAISPRIPVRAAAGGPAVHEERVLHNSYVEHRFGQKVAFVAGVGLLCLFWGWAVSVADWKALIVGAALVTCVLILVDFRIGVVLLVLLMPISASAVFPHEMGGIKGLNPLNLLLAATLAAYLLHALLDKSISRFIPQPLLWLYIVPFLIAGVIGSRHVHDIAPIFFYIGKVDYTSAFDYMRDMLLKPLFLVIFALLVAAAVARMQRPERLLVAYVASVWIMCLLGVVFFVLSGANLGQLAMNSDREYLSPLGMHANELGRVYAIAYALLLFLWAETRDHGARIALLGTIGLVVLALAVTLSRGGFVGFAIVSVLFLVSRRRIGSLLVGATVAVAALYFLPEAIYQRLTTGFGMGANAISAGRINAIWLPLVPDVLASPLYGHGIGSMLWSEAVRSGRSLVVTHAHNAYLQTLLDMGVIGLVLLCAYFFHAWQRFRALAADAEVSAVMRGFFQGAAAAVVAYSVMSLADGRLTPGPAQVFLWLAIGMMYGHYARKAAR